MPAEAMAGANGFGRPGYPGQPRRPAMTRTTMYSGCSRSMSRSG